MIVFKGVNLNCHICGKSTVSFTDEKSGVRYYHCNHCKYMFKAPENYEDFKSQKERYNLHENNEDDEGYIAYFKRFLQFTLPHTNNIKSALDFGCGRTSLLAQLLEKEGIESDYYDPIYFPDNLNSESKYDLIVSTEVFEHLHDPRQTFGALIEMLEQGGYLAIQTQFHYNDIASFKTWYYHRDPTHVVFFTVKSFEVLSGLFDCSVVADNGKNMVVIQKR
jgi:SAM-dependent methyltransferase